MIGQWRRACMDEITLPERVGTPDFSGFSGPRRLFGG